jgi:hypothetical protein
MHQSAPDPARSKVASVSAATLILGLLGSLRLDAGRLDGKHL